MSNEEYIASGILELYAAGGLDQAERTEVEMRAARSPEIRLALDEACYAMENYAQLYAVSPRPDLRERVLSTIHKQSVAPPVSGTEKNGKVLPLYSSGKEPVTPYKWLFAASVGLFLISGILSFFFYNRWQKAEEQLALVTASERKMAQNAETVSLKSRQLEEALAIMRNPEFKPVKLEGVAGNAECKMVVYWSPGEQQVYVDKIKLPAPPTGMQYQLWALNNGQPVDAGMLSLDAGNDYFQQMKSVKSAQAFAVTLEPLGGSKSPNLEQLMVMGEVKA